MSQLEQKWDKLTAKVHLLTDKLREQHEQIVRLNASISKLQEEKENWLKEKNELNENINILKLAKGVGLSDQERNKVKKQIEHYINEIDDCLAKINA